jgi:hypothetical protein
MLREIDSPQVPGLVKLGSVQELRLYLKDLMVRYEKESDRCGEKVGRLMRIIDEEMTEKGVKKLREVGWKRSGMVMLNMDEPVRGTLELIIEAMEDYKAKAKRTGEVLARISQLEDLGVPDNSTILVYLRHGVPLRVVVDSLRIPEVDQLIPVLS